MSEAITQVVFRSLPKQCYLLTELNNVLGFQKCKLRQSEITKIFIHENRPDNV